MGKIRLGILGAANIASRYINVLLNKKCNYQFYGIASRNKEKAALFAGKYGITEVFENYKSLLNSNKIDAVYIPLNNQSHCEWIIKSANSKKHILVEKPLCLNSAEFKQIENSVLKNNVILMEAIMTSFHPWQNTLSKIIKSKQYGDLISTDTEIFTIFNDKNNYRYTDKQGAGVFYDMAPYWISFIQSVINEKPVDFEIVESKKNEDNVLVSAAIHAKFQDGIISRFSTSFEKPFKATHLLKFEEKELLLRNFFTCSFGTNKMIIKISPEDSSNGGKIVFPESNYYENQLEEFIAVINGRQSKPDLSVYNDRVHFLENLSKRLNDF